MSRPLSAVLFSPSWPPEKAHNGVVSYVAGLESALRAEGVDVRVLAGELLEHPAPASVTSAAAERNTAAHYLANKALRVVDPTAADRHHGAWRVGRALARLDRARPVDLYEIEEAFGNGRHLTPRAPGRQVVRLHGPWFLCAPALGEDPGAPEHATRIAAEGDAIAEADAISSPSRDALDAVRERYGLALRDAEVIPNATPLPGRAWARDGATPGAILFVGRFDRLKGADTVIEAFGRLHARRPEVSLTLVGPDRGMPDGAGGHVDLPTFLERTLPREARARVRHLGPASPARIAALRLEAEVAVVASRFETFGMTVIEGLAAGAPLVASRAGAIPELLDFAGDDLLFEAGSAEDLARKLEWLLREPAAADALAREGRRVCRERYAPEAVARRTRAFYERVVRGR